MTNGDKQLPVIQTDLDEGEPSCSPKIYISNEEAALLAQMRRLREQSMELKRELRSADSEQRSRLESEIKKMRAKWKDLANQREKAFLRKMIMLGHLPAEADSDPA
jgi:predicted  nucleic acid-binding Zn-ribbon protein